MRDYNRSGMAGQNAVEALRELAEAHGGASVLRRSGEAREAFFAALPAILAKTDGRAVSRVLREVCELFRPDMFVRRDRALRAQQERRKKKHRSPATSTRRRRSARPTCRRCGGTNLLTNDGECVNRSRCARRAARQLTD